MIDALHYAQGRPPFLDGAADHRMYDHQEYLAQERSLRAHGVRPPRRAQSTFDYTYPMPSARSEPRTVLVRPTSPTLSSRASADSLSATPPHHTIHEEVVAAAAKQQYTSAKPHPAEEQVRPTRPKLGKPRRSYSVMDYEPVLPTQQPSPNLGLDDLPAELHYAIFDFLDPIDSTCLGLTNKHYYAIHRRMHGTTPLSVRRAGPNDMEWVWHLAGRMVHHGKPDAETVKATTNALAMLRVRGQALCRKCGVERCELHKHIQDWMGPGYEYCTVREKFGPAAPEGAREFCYLSNPKDPHRCGRHRVHKSRPTTPEQK